MIAYLRAWLAVGFFLAVLLFALPALSAPANPIGHKSVHHRVADFAKSKALASPAPDLVPATVLPPGLEIHGRLPTPETEGLSRKAEDCSRGGCIDN
jgi:hypothetical protein